jgi:3-methyladenine DNA glycosylase AlkD
LKSEHLNSLSLDDHVKAQEAIELGQGAALLVKKGEETKALVLLSPVLAARTPFRLLEHIGAAIGTGPTPRVDNFLKRIASDKTEGGWVIIGCALRQQLDRELAGALARCRKFIVAADVWYGCDILAERVPGPALIADLGTATKLLALWREDDNRWVRRSVGVAVHFWAKRSLGLPENAGHAETLLEFLEPMFEEQDPDAVKGVGWGLKTLGKYYPELASSWLAEQIVHRRRHPRALTLRKSMTYLSVDQRARVAGRVT